MNADKRPSNCRNRLRDEGKAHPRSGCASCRTGGLTGCPYERPDVQVVSGATAPQPTGFAWIEPLYQAVQMIGKRPYHFNMDVLSAFYRALNEAAIWDGPAPIFTWRPYKWTDTRILQWIANEALALDAKEIARLVTEEKWSEIAAEWPDFVEWMERQT